MRPLSVDSQFVRKDAETNRNAIDKIKAEGIRRWGKSAQIAFVYVAHDIPRLSKKKEWNWDYREQLERVVYFKNRFT